MGFWNYAGAVAVEWDYHRPREFYSAVFAFGFAHVLLGGLVGLDFHVVTVFWIVGHIFVDSGCDWIECAKSGYVFPASPIFANRNVLRKSYFQKSKTNCLGGLFLISEYRATCAGTDRSKSAST